MKRKDNVFDNVFMKRPDSSVFDLGHDKKLTLNMGELITVACMETLPADNFRLDYVTLLRFMPLVSPVMHKIRVTTDYYFCPNRIIFDGWEDFITGVDPGSGPVEAPWIEITGDVPKGSIADYLGIPPGNYDNVPLKVSVLPVAAYYKIYDDWYRWQSGIGETMDPVVPGDNTTVWLPKLIAEPLNRAWEFDYFTAALPTPQQGADVELPLISQGNVLVEAVTGGAPNAGTFMRRTATGAAEPAGDIVHAPGPAPLANGVFVNADPAYYDPNGTLFVDIQADAASINDLRQAFALQAFLERSIRGGLRYFEQMFSHFGQKSPDARLQRPEFIGRNVQNVVISEVLATAQDSGEGFAIGSMGGHGISVGGKDSLSYHCEEHGFIIGIMNVQPDTAYMDGVHKQFTRFDRLDYAFPDFAHIGEQAIAYKELLCHDVPIATDIDQTFGYIPRYSEYRYWPSSVAGDFRDVLEFWTLGRKFSATREPALTADFINCDDDVEDLNRIFAVTSEAEDHILAQVINKFTVKRKLPRHGVPSTL